VRVGAALLTQEHVPVTVPAAGLEPAAHSSSASCSTFELHRNNLQRRRQESNLLGIELQPTAWPSSPSVIYQQSQRWDSNPLKPLYRSGARPAEHHWHQQQPVLVSSQLDRGSKPQSPPEGLASRSRASGGTRTHCLRFTGAALDPSSITGFVQGGRWESNPQRTGSQPVLQSTGVRPQYPWQESNLHDFRLRRAACFRHTPGIFVSTPTRNRTWTCSFGRSHDVHFTIRARSSGGWGRTSIDGFRDRRPTV
jgi:hypothetical protein